MQPHAPRPIRTILLCGAFFLGAGACGPPGPPPPPEESVVVPASGKVVVYVETLRRTAAPVLRLFQDETGIKVEAHYRGEDPGGFEAALRREAAAGHVDLVWAESPLLPLDLAADQLLVPFRPAGARPILAQYRDPRYLWIGFAVNPRVFLYSDDIGKSDAPSSLEDLTTGSFSGKAAVPGIGWGAPAFQVASWFARKGEATAGGFLEKVRAAGNRILADDGAVRRAVADGTVPWGIVGLDEAICAKREADPVNIMFPDRVGSGVVAVPQVMALVRNAPNPQQAKGLYGYMFTTEVAFQLGQNDCALVTLLPDIPKPDWVPALGAFNVTLLDNDAAYAAYRAHREAFRSWGSAPVGTPVAAAAAPAATPPDR